MSFDTTWIICQWQASFLLGERRLNSDKIEKQMYEHQHNYSWNRMWITSSLSYVTKVLFYFFVTFLIIFLDWQTLLLLFCVACYRNLYKRLTLQYICPLEERDVKCVVKECGKTPRDERTILFILPRYFFYTNEFYLVNLNTWIQNLVYGQWNILKLTYFSFGIRIR